MEILGSRPSLPKNRITALKPALRDKSRVNIFVDDEFSFSLDLAQVVDYKLKIGRILSDSELSDLKSASEFGKLYASTLEWVLTRPRSEKETRDHLTQKLRKRELENKRRASNREKLAADPALKSRQKDLKIPTRELPLFSSADIEKVIEKLKAKTYLDDRKFAAFYVENRNLKKGISARQLKTELSRKGIDRSLIEELLEASGRSDESEAKKLLDKQLKKLPDLTTALDDPNLRIKLLRRLVSKGFSYDLATSLLDTYSSPDSPNLPE